jgi:2-iminobutanoate/2-iminopropanoate deaminase
MRQFIKNTEGVPKVNAPISQAVVVGKHCYISGQLATDLDGNFIKGTVLEEAEQAFKNIFAIAKAANFKISDIVFIDLAFIDLADISVINLTAYFLIIKNPQERCIKRQLCLMVEK